MADHSRPRLRAADVRCLFMLLFLILGLCPGPERVGGQILRDDQAMVLTQLQLVWGKTFSGWQRGSNCTNAEYISCDSGGSIIEMFLAQNNISGSIPVELGSLTTLINLALDRTSLSGSIPEALSSLTSLRKLNLGTNQLSGSIPGSLGALQKISELYLDNNNLSGTIPASISEMQSLEYLYLFSNQLEGNIPDLFNGLRMLKHLRLDRNQLTGSIPSSISALVQLKTLHLGDNQLSGSIPVSLSALHKISALYLYVNKLSGTIPVALSTLVNLKILNLGTSQLSGSIPESLGTLQHISELYLDTNQLSGSIPASLGRMQSLQKLYLFSNMLEGRIPDIFNGMRVLEELKISSNPLTGQLPTSLAKVQSLVVLEVPTWVRCPDMFSPCPGLPPSDQWGTFCNAKCIEFCTSCDKVPKPPPPPVMTRPRPPATSRRPPPLVRRLSPPLTSPPLPTPPPPVEARTYGFYASAVFSPRYLNKNVFRHASWNYSFDSQRNWIIRSSIDWKTTMNFVGQAMALQVYNQGPCASCWAMAAVTAVNAAAAIVFQQLDIGSVPHLSVQQVINCNNRFGCSGGLPAAALDYIANYSLSGPQGPNGLRGLYIDLNYPYTTRDETCQFPTCPTCNPTNFGISMWEQADFYGWFGLLLTVQRQPAIVTLQAACMPFLSYSQGIFRSTLCDGVPDHAVVVLGYVLNDGVPYWILQNSWGTMWGEQGRIRMAITGGFGLCNMHLSPALYPVINTADPCSNRLNPCGAGTCTRIGPYSSSCKCQDPFVAVTNIDGRTQSCTPKAVCSFFLFNPCSVGTCVDDQLGGYTCLCPPRFVEGIRSTDGSNTCVPGNALQPQTYTVKSRGLTCFALASAFGLTLTQLRLQNRNTLLACGATPIPLQTVVNVTRPKTLRTCGVLYTWGQADNCQSVADRFSIPGGFAGLVALNPWLNCTTAVPTARPQPGMQVCLRSGTTPASLPNCTNYYTAQNGDTCDSIRIKFKIDVFLFYSLNPGIYCDHLKVSQAGNMASGQQVCISANTTSFQMCPARTLQRRIVEGDTCLNLIARFFRSLRMMAMLNFNFQCAPRQLYVGKVICVPATSGRPPPPNPKKIRKMLEV